MVNKDHLLKYLNSSRLSVSVYDGWSLTTLSSNSSIFESTRSINLTKLAPKLDWSISKPLLTDYVDLAEIAKASESKRANASSKLRKLVDFFGRLTKPNRQGRSRGPDFY